MLKSIIKLARIEHGVLASLIVVATYIICGGKDPMGALALFLSTFFAEIFLFVTNDIHNIEEDRINRPDAPLVKGDVGLNVAWIVSILSLVLSVIINIIGILDFKLSPWSALILGIALTMGYLYNYYVKKVLLLNNIFVSVTSSLTFLYGLYAIGINTPYILPYFLFITSALATMGRELIKGAIDIKGDAAVGVRTVANTYGMKHAITLAVVFAMLAVVSSVFLIMYSLTLWFSYVFIAGVLLTDLLLIYLCIMIIKKDGEYLEGFRRGALMAMSITIITYLLMALLQLLIS